MNPNVIIQPHDNKDLGWHVTKKHPTPHYYRSNGQSNIAISHCGAIEHKVDLAPASDVTRCEFCNFIEKLRKAVSDDTRTSE